jgi:MYXO-CTERM domain-containing protein
MTKRNLLLCLLWLAALTAPQSAAAFSDYEVFGLAPLEGGGGGGRYFTTSPIDGYGCGVCHTGGIAPAVQLRGLPESEFVPGAAYDVELVWLFPQEPHSLTLEIVNTRGEAAGDIVLPAILEAADRCTDPEMPNEPAARLIEEALPRRLLWLSQCGASRLRFRFVAPQDLELTFAMSMVRADRSEKPEGDGVTEIRRVLRRQGFAKQESGGCALSHGAAPPGSGLALAMTLLLVAFSARRRRQR